MGVYPMLRDETCFFLAVDLDKPAWQEHARAVLETCGVSTFRPRLERSRSGQGGHVWFFFSESYASDAGPQAGFVRLDGNHGACPEIGLDRTTDSSPTRDTLPLAASAV